MKDEANKKLDMTILSTYRAEVYGITILWIMLFHGYLAGVDWSVKIPVLSVVGEFLIQGNMGVEAFLFLSGISLYYSMMKDDNPARFLGRRFRRLYPPVIIINGFYCVWMHFFENRSWANIGLTLTALRFWLDGNQEIWFVSLLLLLYVLYPFIFSYIYNRETYPGIFGRGLLLMLLVMLTTIWIRDTASTSEMYKLLEIAITRIPVFIVGCCFGKLVYEKKKVSAIWWVPVWTFMLLCFLILHSDELHSAYRRWFLMMGGVPLVFLFAGAMAHVPDAVRKPFRLLGSMSLELYVMHLMLNRLYTKGLFLFPYVSGSKLRWLGIVLAAILLSYLVMRAENWLFQRIDQWKETIRLNY